MRKTQNIPCNCITYPCNCPKPKPIIVDGSATERYVKDPKIIGGSDTEKKVFAERISKAKRKARNRKIVFLVLLGGVIYLATRK